MKSADFQVSLVPKRVQANAAECKRNVLVETEDAVVTSTSTCGQPQAQESQPQAQPQAQESQPQAQSPRRRPSTAPSAYPEYRAIASPFPVGGPVLPPPP